MHNQARMQYFIHKFMHFLLKKTTMSILSDNLKVLIWQNQKELGKMSYKDYIAHVAVQCGIAPLHFHALILDKDEATSAEEGNICNFFSDSGFDLTTLHTHFLFSDLMEQNKQELIDKNLHYLISSLDWGENNDFIRFIGVNSSTAFRWKQGSTRPDAKKQLLICQYFGYNNTNVLWYGFLFFDLEPLSYQHKLKYCKRMLDEMPKEEFERIYPAICKLLS